MYYFCLKEMSFSVALNFSIQLWYSLLKALYLESRYLYYKWLMRMYSYLFVIWNLKRFELIQFKLEFFHNACCFCNFLLDLLSEICVINLASQSQRLIFLFKSHYHLHLLKVLECFFQKFLAKHQVLLISFRKDLLMVEPIYKI